MRVIDCHTHTWTRELLSKSDIEARKLAAVKTNTTPILDSPVQDLQTAMIESEIEKAVVLPIDSGINQDMPLSLVEKTDWHAAEVKDFPSIITFVGIDPRRGDEGLKELERAVKEKDCRGLKLYPPNGFYPDEDRFYPIYEQCLDLEIPVVVHQGFTSRHKHLKYAQPVYLDKMAADFPELNIVLAHVGYPWVEEALLVAAKNPKVYIDISGWQMIVSKVPMKFFQMIADAKLSRVFPDKVLWGSDFPLFESYMPLTDWVQFCKGLTLPEVLRDQGYPQIIQRDIEKVMWKNAVRFFAFE